ncbi:MAG: hypothetical protein RLZZ505_1881 [Verrucomicrobiota bacterium]
MELEGCRVGFSIGDKILEAYRVYLQMAEHDREKISVSDIHIDLPHIENDAEPQTIQEARLFNEILLALGARVGRLGEI